MKKNNGNPPDSGNFYTEFNQPTNLPPANVPPHHHSPDYSNSMPPADPNQRPKGRKKKKSKKKALLVLAIILVLLVAGFWYIFGGLTINSITGSSSELGIDPAIESKYKYSGVTNIALFGVDSRDQNVDEGRSDSIMILSIDRKNNVMKLTSILRDSYVAIDGHGSEKITHAYAYGGPVLAIKTINQNFKLDIKNYITVNFSQLANVIDAIGGIDLEISEVERVQINALANSEGMSAPELPSAGMVHLNGTQATAYSRIRHSDSDNARADRQKKVVECMLTQIKKNNVLKYPQMAKSIFPMTETSLNYADLAALSPALIFGKSTLIQNTVPAAEDNAIGGEYEGAWVWRFDLEAASNRLHQFIYEAKPTSGE